MTIVIGGHRGPVIGSPTKFTHSAHLQARDLDALAAIQKQREENLKMMFTGTTIVFKPLEAAKQARATAKKLKKVVSTVKKGPKEAKPNIVEASKTAYLAASEVPATLTTDKAAVVEFLKASLNVSSLAEVAEALPELGIVEIAADITPLVGQVVSGYKTIRELTKTAQSIHAHYKTGQRIKDLLPGDPFAAGIALRTMIRRDIGDHASKAAIQGTKFGLSTASLAGDGGMAASVAMTLVSLTQKLVMIGMELTDMRAGNRRLANPETLDLTIFDDCPLLGCYLIVCSNTSDIVNLITLQIGAPGWMGDVERMVKTSISPMISDATSVIKHSHLELQGLKQNKIVQKPGMLGKLVKKLH
ncbi:hypothetical protein [Inquilinus sp. CAU 1745]|uniref:hypothetical protein n=1 Tax=Inquilinus sp. CAU 1745 TaxID=3140369 RepID=UPI00325A6480